MMDVSVVFGNVRSFDYRLNRGMAIHQAGSGRVMHFSDRCQF